MVIIFPGHYCISCGRDGVAIEVGSHKCYLCHNSGGDEGDEAVA